MDGPSTSAAALKALGACTVGSVTGTGSDSFSGSASTTSTDTGSGDGQGPIVPRRRAPKANNELWRGCVDWLVRLEVLSAKHKVNQKDTDLRTFALALRDGVILCNLAMTLDSASINTREFTRTPQMAQFLCYKNIKLFLDACRKSFRLREMDLFEPTMLYDLTNFHRVLMTLSQLSQSPKVMELRPDVPGFDLKLSCSSRSSSKEPIYKELSNTDKKTDETNADGEHLENSPQSGSVSVDEDSDVTVENGTEDTEGYVEDNVSAMCDTIDDEILSVNSISSGITLASNSSHNSKKSDTQQDATIVSTGNRRAPPLAIATNALGQSQNLQREAAAAYNYQTIAREPGHEYLNDFNFEEDEKVYEDLCYVTFPMKPSELPAGPSPEQREYVIRELLDTEQNYIQVLKSLDTKFMQPLEDVMTEEELKIVFPRIRELYRIHTSFYNRLQDSVHPNSRQKLGNVFLEFRRTFLIYGEYCCSLPRATAMLANLCRTKLIVATNVRRCEKEYNTGKLLLRDILPVPMQRILKYSLILAKLVKETVPTHEDYRSLERAADTMVDVSTFINEMKRDSDHLLVLQKVKDSIVDLHLMRRNDLNLAQFGHLLLDGEFYIKPDDETKPKLRYGFVFDKVMILVKPLNNKSGDMQYTYKDLLNILDYHAEIMPTRRAPLRDNRFKYQLYLGHLSATPTNYIMFLKSELEREKWNKALLEAKGNLKPPGLNHTDHKLEIKTYIEPTTCKHCSKFLHGRIHQGYRCVNCEIDVHKKCIPTSGRCGKQAIMSLRLPRPLCDRNLTSFYWFAGYMERHQAEAALQDRAVGTYLLRCRPMANVNQDESMYALTVKAHDSIKHMKIFHDFQGEQVKYFLSDQRSFRSVVQLIEHYEVNDLSENFVGLNQTLQYPFTEVYATVKYDYDPKESHHLMLRVGTQVLIVGKEGDNEGWWRGRIGDIVGFFPKQFVEVAPAADPDL